MEVGLATAIGTGDEVQAPIGTTSVCSERSWAMASVVSIDVGGRGETRFVRRQVWTAPRVAVIPANAG